MGKKIDLNSPKKNTSGFHHRKGNHLFSNTRPKNNYNTENQIGESSEKESTNNVTNNQYIPKISDTVKATIKMPIKTKIVFTVLLVAIPFVLLMLFVVLFSDENSSSGMAEGFYNTNGICNTVEVHSTDCSTVNGEYTCNNTYDGEYPLEEYIANVVTAELSRANNVEVYKTLAIAARTFLFAHVDDSCSIAGNATRQSFRPVENSPYKDMILQAVEETQGIVMVVDGELSPSSYSSACTVRADDNYYYVRYGRNTLGSANYQQIPKSFDSEEPYAGYLASWYSQVDKNSTDYDNIACPNNHDRGMTQIGALYLANELGYTYDEIIDFYYGEDVILSSINQPINTSNVVNGFSNPLAQMTCSSGYGCRLLNGKYNLHKGIDLPSAEGTPIYATKDGTVKSVVNYVSGFEYNSYGNYVLIEHNDGSQTRYAHMQLGSIPDSITVGATVNQGEFIGNIGNTGESYGAHLHYEVIINGNIVNPIDYLDLTNANNSSACNNNVSISMSYCN